MAALDRTRVSEIGVYRRVDRQCGLSGDAESEECEKSRDGADATPPAPLGTCGSCSLYNSPSRSLGVN